MVRLEQRIQRVEEVLNQRASDLSMLSDEELYQRIDEGLAGLGTSRERVIAEHGSLEDYAKFLRREEAGKVPVDIGSQP